MIKISLLFFSCIFVPYVRAYARLTIHVDYYRYYEINVTILLNITTLMCNLCSNQVLAFYRDLSIYEEVQ